ncbi:NUDIX hydrolase [Arboricoccus pini]|nr:NUDIX domain-containing protein [Arboricoccus pini]
MSQGEHPLTAVLAMVRREDHLLLGRRRKAPDLGLWGFPGGRLEWGETLVEAALRELDEETAVSARALRLLPPLEIIRPKEGLHVVLCPVLCAWQAGEGRLADDELAELAWMTAGQVRALDPATASRDLASLAATAFQESLA